MEEQIKRAVRNLNIGYVFFWVFPAFLLGAQKENRQYDYHASTETLCAMEHCPIGNT